MHRHDVGHIDVKKQPSESFAHQDEHLPTRTHEFSEILRKSTKGEHQDSTSCSSIPEILGVTTDEYLHRDESMRPIRQQCWPSYLEDCVTN